MNNTIVSIQNLSHRYGTDWAIRDINMEIKSGILGLLGSNGAGKSTTMNIMCGVLNQTSGEVFINGIDLGKNPFEAKKLIGFLPQNPPLYLDFTVQEYLNYAAGLRLMEGKHIKDAVNVVMEQCGVAHYRKRLIKNLSGGYRQRVGIAQAIVHSPMIVVLDEPTNGLDPNQILEIRNLIKEIAIERSVIFSSHILSEVQATCDEIKMIENGQIVFSDTVDAFNNYLEPDTLLVTMMNRPAEDELKRIPGVTNVEYLELGKIKVQFKGNHNISEKIVADSVANGWQLREISLEKVSLDETFAQLSNKQRKK